MSIGPIIIIDDDKDDLEFINQAFFDLKVENEVIVFDDGMKFIDFMKTTDQKAFFILCDVNMGKINGLELKKIVFDDERLRLKCIPFLFFSTSRASDSILKAYSFGVQGYFIKPDSLEKYKDMFYSMISYWSYSQHPNK